ncbi:hypothetical protein ACFX14_046829 [Malus domestica]
MAIVQPLHLLTVLHPSCTIVQSCAALHSSHLPPAEFGIGQKEWLRVEVRTARVSCLPLFRPLQLSVLFVEVRLHWRRGASHHYTFSTFAILHAFHLFDL